MLNVWARFFSSHRIRKRKSKIEFHRSGISCPAYSSYTLCSWTIERVSPSSRVNGEGDRPGAIHEWMRKKNQMNSSGTITRAKLTVPKFCDTKDATKRNDSLFLRLLLLFSTHLRFDKFRRFCSFHDSPPARTFLFIAKRLDLFQERRRIIKSWRIAVNIFRSFIRETCSRQFYLASKFFFFYDELYSNSLSINLIKRNFKETTHFNLKFIYSAKVMNLYRVKQSFRRKKKFK